MIEKIKKELRERSTPERARVSQSFFKTGAGQYGERDVFIGVTMPDQRKIAKKYVDLPLDDIRKLLHSKEHEFRMTALLIVTYRYLKASESEQKQFYEFYISNTKWINNWDLVDVTAPRIVGVYLQDKDKSSLFSLAQSESLWERRIAILATLAFMKQGEYETTFSLARLLLHDKHDLMHKAVGWMLREVGKQCSEDKERRFLDQYAKEMPRTMLRYAIERFSEDVRKKYLAMK
jgi:3-methyladenine DNA glycosylase AlkD